MYTAELAKGETLLCRTGLIAIELLGGERRRKPYTQGVSEMNNPLGHLWLVNYLIAASLSSILASGNPFSCSML